MTLSERMSRHDWYFDYSDDHERWLTASAEDRAIRLALLETPLAEATKLIQKYIPADLRSAYLLDILELAKSRVDRNKL